MFNIMIDHIILKSQITEVEESLMSSQLLCIQYAKFFKSSIRNSANFVNQMSSIPVDKDDKISAYVLDWIAWISSWQWPPYKST